MALKHRHIPLAAVACLAGLLAATASPATTPAQLEASIIAAARSQHSVHYVSQISVGGTTIQEVTDAGFDKGIQRVTITGGGTTGHVTVIVSKGSVYVRGDAFTLEHFVGFSTADAQADAGSWTRIPSGSSLYKNTAVDVTLGSLAGDLRLKGTIARATPHGIGGKHGVALTGTGAQMPGSATLYAQSGSLLPLQEVVNAKAGHASITLSLWNEAVHVAVPANPKTLLPPLLTA